MDYRQETHHAMPFPSRLSRGRRKEGRAGLSQSFYWDFHRKSKAGVRVNGLRLALGGLSSGGGPKLSYKGFKMIKAEE